MDILTTASRGNRHGLDTNSAGLDDPLPNREKEEVALQNQEEPDNPDGAPAKSQQPGGRQPDHNKCSCSLKLNRLFPVMDFIITGSTGCDNSSNAPHMRPETCLARIIFEDFSSSYSKLKKFCREKEMEKKEESRLLGLGLYPPGSRPQIELYRAGVQGDGLQRCSGPGPAEGRLRRMKDALLDDDNSDE